jgi:hypothetical protein
MLAKRCHSQSLAEHSRQLAAATLSNQASLAARASNDWRSMLIMVRIVF